MRFLNRILNYWSFFNKAKRAGVIIGERTKVHTNFWSSSEPYLIKIGSDCAITKGVMIFTHGGSRVGRVKYPNFDVFGKVIIGDRVYIGTNSLIMPGVEIGNDVLISAGSVVTKSIPSGFVVGGNPAKILCTVDEFICRNEAFNLNSKQMNRIEKKQFLQNLPDTKFVQKPKMKRPF